MKISVEYYNDEKEDVIWEIGKKKYTKNTIKNFDDLYLVCDHYYLHGVESTSSIVKIRFTILEIHPGTKYDDTCISELYFFGYAEGNYNPQNDPNNPDFDPPDLQESP